jgi:hypothetical protein
MNTKGHENRSLVRFDIWWNSLNKTSIFPIWLRSCIAGNLKFSNFKILSMQFCFWTPNYWTKMPLDLFYCEICLTKLSFQSKFEWEVPLGLKISQFWVRILFSNTKLQSKSTNRLILWWNLLNKTKKMRFS